MKKITFKFSILFLWFLALNTKILAQTSLLDDVNQRIQAIRLDGFDIDTANRSGELAGSQNFVALQNLCRARWSDIADQLDSVTDGNSGKKLILDACENLDAPNYMSFLEKIVARFKSGQLDLQLVDFALVPYGRMKLFLSFNYRHPRVQALLQSLKESYPSNGPYSSLIDNTLDGTRKAHLTEMLAAHQLGNIPIITLSP